MFSSLETFLNVQKNQGIVCWHLKSYRFDRFNCLYFLQVSELWKPLSAGHCDFFHIWESWISCLCIRSTIKYLYPVLSTDSLVSYSSYNSPISGYPKYSLIFKIFLCYILMFSIHIFIFLFDLVSDWEQLSEFVSLLEIFRSHLDILPGCRSPAWARELDQMTTRGPFQSLAFCESVISQDIVIHSEFQKLALESDPPSQVEKRNKHIL